MQKFGRLAFVFALASLALAVPACRKGPPKSVVPIIRAEPWWEARHAMLAERAKEGDVDLIMIGDSITHGWEKDAPELWRRLFGDWKAVNLGFNGDRTEHVLWRLQNGEIDGIEPKLAVVMIGTNNSERGDSPEKTILGIEAIVGELRTRLPTTTIVLLAIFPRGLDADDRYRRRNEEVNRRLAEFADGERVVFLDINERFLGPGGELSRKIMPDLVHPSPEGYRIWAEAMKPKIDRLLR